MSIDKTKKEITQEAELVYCKNCVWFRTFWSWRRISFLEKCIHPKNWQATWKERVRRHPWSINRCNNCKWFETGCYSRQSLSELRSKPD